MKSKSTGFTLIELMVVILIVAVLAAAAIPLMRGRIDQSKWSEANASAGAIRNAVKTYFMDSGNIITGDLDDTAVQQALGMQSGDLTGSYFTASDYTIDSVNSDGVAVITVTGSQTNAPSGSKTLALDGTFD
ncbi:MAG: prepilin-type N-terminal cleavage/methylation domain-containing protein [Planctomycetota bacterium]|jgi:prepilin-type N-terminal cleavage/methylation domain-containing protein